MATGANAIAGAVAGPAAGPDTWLNAAGAGVNGSAAVPDLGQWWQALGDAVLPPLIAEALARNTDVRSAQASLRQLRALRGEARAALWPSLTATGSVGRSTSSALSSSGGSHTAWNAALDASWELDWLGANRATVVAADADVQSSAATLAATRVSLAAEVALDYVQLRALQTRLATARNNLATQGETWQITDWRRQAGLVGSLDAEQARTELETTRATIPTLETALAQVETALALALGRSAADIRARLQPPAPLPALPDHIDASLPAAALARRPDVIAADIKVSAEVARLRAARAARFPQISLSAALGRSALSLSGLGQSEASTRSLLAQLTAPLFDAGLIRQKIEAQDAVLERARIAYEAAVLTALRDVEDALSSLRGSRLRVQALQAAVSSSRNAALLARQQYNAGLTDFQTVLSTERSQLSTEDSLTTAQADGVSALVRLYKALGGGWQAATPP